MPRGHRGGGGRDARWKRKAEHMSYTLRDIASLTGFSKSTISRVINGDTNVKDSTREEIMERLAELGYVPNQIAKGLKSELPLIGVIIQDIRNPYYTQMLYNFDIITKRHGYTLLYMNSNNDAATERSNIEYLLGMKVKGIIFVASLPRQNGPISTPATRYAVTDGSPSGFASLVIKSPARMATDRESKICICSSCDF